VARLRLALCGLHQNAQVLHQPQGGQPRLPVAGRHGQDGVPAAGGLDHPPRPATDLTQRVAGLLQPPAGFVYRVRGGDSQIPVSSPGARLTGRENL